MGHEVAAIISSAYPSYGFFRRCWYNSKKNTPRLCLPTNRINYNKSNSAMCMRRW